MGHGRGTFQKVLEMDSGTGQGRKSRGAMDYTQVYTSDE